MRIWAQIIFGISFSRAEPSGPVDVVKQRNGKLLILNLSVIKFRFPAARKWKHTSARRSQEKPELRRWRQWRQSQSNCKADAWFGCDFSHRSCLCGIEAPTWDCGLCFFGWADGPRPRNGESSLVLAGSGLKTKRFDCKPHPFVSPWKSAVKIL